MKKIPLIFALVSSILSFSQEIKGRILDQSTQEPIPFVNVLLSDNYGVITNDEGYFVMQQKDFPPSTAIKFSCMGFEEVNIKISDYKSGQIVFLKQSNNTLKEITLRNTNYSALEVMQKVNENLAKNHNIEDKRIQFFMRTKNISILKKANFSVKKAAVLSKSEIKEINEAIKQQNLVEVKPFTNFNESLFNAYFEQDSTKISYIKYLELTNPEKENSAESKQGKLIKRVFENLKSDHTFNIKTGIIPIAKNKKIGDFLSDIAKDTVKNVLGNEFKALINKNRLASKTFITIQKDFNYTKEEITVINGMVCYHIGFKPKKKSGKFEGDLYINADDFAVVKYNYKLIEGELLNSMNLKLLLGIKINTFERSEVGFLTRSNQGVYYPRYIKTSINSYGYFDRSLSITENNPNKKERKELKLELMQEATQLAVNELLAIEIEDSPSKINIPKFIIADKTSKHDPNYWKNYNIIESTEEIKNYE